MLCREGDVLFGDVPFGDREEVPLVDTSTLLLRFILCATLVAGKDGV